MTRIFLVALFSMAVACTSESNENLEISTLPISITQDNFIKNLEYGKIAYDQASNDIRSNLPIDRIDERHGDKYLYLLYEVSRFSVNKDYSVRLYYLARNNNLGLEAYIERFFLVTFDSENKAISSLEVGTFEAHFGLEILMTSTISEQLEISRITVKKEDNTSSGETVASTSASKYYITETGVITKRQ